MKVTKDIVMRDIADETILVPVGELAKRFRGIMSLNEGGRLLWKQLMEGCSRGQLVESLLETYEVEEDVACKDVDAFLADLRKAGVLVE